MKCSFFGYWIIHYIIALLRLYPNSCSDFGWTIWCLKGWLRILRRSTIGNRFLCAELLQRVRQCRCRGKIRPDSLALAPTTDAVFAIAAMLWESNEPCYFAVFVCLVLHALNFHHHWKNLGNISTDLESLFAQVHWWPLMKHSTFHFMFSNRNYRDQN